MGKRGPAPAPTTLKLVRGTRPDRVNTAEPAPGELPVAAPSWLTHGAFELWTRYAPDLQRQGVLKAWDCEAFAAWCDAVVRRAAAAQALDREGMVVEASVFDRNGKCTGFRYQKSEWWGIWKDANEVIARVGARFGLTPSDRSQLKVGDGTKAAPAERLLSG